MVTFPYRGFLLYLLGLLVWGFLSSLGMVRAETDRESMIHSASSYDLAHWTDRTVWEDKEELSSREEEVTEVNEGE